jgi:toxin ParE1/3/4
MKLVWTLRAKKDLLEIGTFIAKDKSAAARRWVEKLRQRARMAKEMPIAGRKVPEINRDDVREVFLANYRIVYLVKKESIVVLTIFEGHRRLPQDIIASSKNSEK